MKKFTAIFGALSDKTRLRIVWLLTQAKGSLCVCELVDALNESEYNISRHLKELKVAGLVKEKREGRWVYHFLVEPEDEFQELIHKAVGSISEELLLEDEDRLKRRVALRQNDKCVVGLKSEAWERFLLESSQGE